LSHEELLQQQIQIQQRQHDMLQRELAFLRAGVQPQAPAGSGVDPVVQQAVDMVQITENDLAEVFAGGPRAAEIVQGALQTCMLLGAHIAEQRLIRAYQQDQASRVQQQHYQTQSEGMRNAFWESNPELQNHQAVVQFFAREVATEQPQKQFDWNQAAREVARRSYQYLSKQYNLNFPGSVATAAATRGGIRPPVGEMGARRTGATGNSRLTDEILDLVRH